MKALTKREELIKAILFLPDDQIESIYTLVQMESSGKSFNLTENLIQGIRELGQIMRGDLDAFPAEDLLNEL